MADKKISELTAAILLTGDELVALVQPVTGLTDNKKVSLADIMTALAPVQQADIVYAGASPSNITVGGMSSGTSLTGRDVLDILEEILVDYLTPAFSAFSISGQATAVKVGTTISGVKTFPWTTTNSSNVSPNTLVIRDNTAAVDLATGLADDSTEDVNVGSVQKVVVASNVWRITGTNTIAGTFTRDFTVNWQWERYYGTSASVTLDETAIEALTTELGSGFAKTYSLGAGNYKYMVWDDALGSPTAGTGFKDASTGFSVDMADVTDNAAYSNTQNGWSYALVSVTNSEGVTSNKRVYRTRAILGGSIDIIVS
jgi:hypothetical protein